MHQIIKTTDGEKYRMYNALEKDELVKMLIECNKHLDRLTPKIETDTNCFYMSGLDTSGKCIYCGKHQFEH